MISTKSAKPFTKITSQKEQHKHNTYIPPFDPYNISQTKQNTIKIPIYAKNLSKVTFSLMPIKVLKG